MRSVAIGVSFVVALGVASSVHAQGAGDPAPGRTGQVSAPATLLAL